MNNLKIAETINKLPIVDEFLYSDNFDTINKLTRDREDTSVEEEALFEIDGNPFNLPEHEEFSFEDDTYYYEVNNDGFFTWGTRILKNII